MPVGRSAAVVSFSSHSPAHSRSSRSLSWRSPVGHPYQIVARSRDWSQDMAGRPCGGAARGGSSASRAALRWVNSVSALRTNGPALSSSGLGRPARNASRGRLSATSGISQTRYPSPNAVHSRAKTRHGARRTAVVHDATRPAAHGRRINARPPVAKTGGPNTCHRFRPPSSIDGTQTRIRKAAVASANTPAARPLRNSRPHRQPVLKP